MKAGVYYGAGISGRRKIEMPETGPEDLLVKKICAELWSDLHAYRQASSAGRVGLWDMKSAGSGQSRC